MADCEEVLRELETFLDGELTADLRHGVEVHLEGCGDCQQLFEFYAELRIVISTRCRSDVLPPGFAERLQSALHLPPDSVRLGPPGAGPGGGLLGSGLAPPHHHDPLGYGER